MNSSSFMDKQVMGLSGSQTDILDLMSPQEEQPINGGGIKKLKEEILPSYDFQPIRPVGASLSSDSNVGGTRVLNSADHRTNSSSNPTTRQNYGSIDLSESAEVIQEKDRNSYTGVTMSDIDYTMKKHADNLLHALEGVSARLTQLDTRTRQIESSVDDLKVSIANNHGNNDGKLRQLENILREVQTGVQVLRDKQELAEAHFQLAKLQTTKGDQQSENQNTTYHSGSVQQQAASAPQLSNQPAAPPVVLPQAPQPLPPLPSTSPLPQAQQNVPPVQHPAQLPQTQTPSVPQQEPHFPPPGQLADATNQHYQLTPPGQSPQPPVPYQHYQSTNLPPHYSQPSPQHPPQQHPPQQHPPQQHSLQQHPPHAPVNTSHPHLQPSLSHQPDETPYVPSQSYPPSIRQLHSVNQPPSSAPPSQPFYGAPSHMYEPTPSNRPGPGFSSGYGGPPSGPSFSDPYPYSGSSSSHYGSSAMKPPQFSATPASSRENSYPRIPTAQMLPQAVPAASSDGGGSSSSGSGNRVPIDDVVDKVATMGFSREQVRATVRKLTENGQSVDLNMVLDKLMNG